MKKLVLIDEENNKQTVLAEDKEINALYTILEDTEFYYTECMHNKYRDESDDVLAKVKDQLEEILFANND